MTFKVLKSTNTNEELIKKSTFIGVCAQVKSSAEFHQFLTHHQDLNATHNCWAYRIDNEYRFNDDGEPSGTAGKPILAAIDGSGFNRVGALVIRYYGGIKLGTGGLARAYGGTIAKNLQTAAYKYHIPSTQIKLHVTFEFSQLLFKITAEHGGKTLHQEYNPQGIVFQVSVPSNQLSAFKKSLLNATKGQAKFIQP